MKDSERKKIAGYLGIAQRAGKIAAGDAAAKESLLHGKAYLLVLAEDAAEKVKTELSALAAGRIPILLWPDKDDLGRIVGKSRRGALTLLDEGFARAIQKTLSDTSAT